MKIPDIVVFDFETTGLLAGHHEPCELAARAYNGMTLEPYPVESGGGFYSLMRPEHFDRIEPKALQVNGKTVEQLKKAPEAGVVWRQFAEWVGRYGRGKWKAPIAAGKNIRNFDLKFVDVLNAQHLKKGAVLFNDRYTIDLEDFLVHWGRGWEEIDKISMDAMRDYFGLSTENAHHAETDVIQTGAVIMRFLKLYETLRSKTIVKNGVERPMLQFRGCFAGSGI